MSFGIPVRNGLAIGLLSSTTLSSNGGLFPAMFLDFLQPFLDSRITFTRGSNATLVDSTGKITYAPANLLLQSQTFDNASWSKIGATVTANTTTAPDGTTTADTLVEDTSTGAHIVFQPVSFVLGTTYIITVFAKAGTRTRLCLINVGGAGFEGYFDLSNGTVISSPVGTASITAAGNGWYRCQMTATAGATTSSNVQFRLVSSGTTTSYTGDGTSGLFLWGAQTEQVTYQTTPSTYVATTSAAYYGPRFDYDPVTLAPKGLLIEEQRTNAFTYSDQFNISAVWVNSNTSVTANATTSPDGTVNADKLVEDSATSLHRIQVSAGYTSGVSYSVSVYAKISGRRYLNINWNAAINARSTFDLQSGVVASTASGTATITPVGNNWYRCTVTGTASATATQSGYLQLSDTAASGDVSYTGDGTSGIFLWGAQLEAGAFATSYIPTVASQVTRSADVATMTGTNFSSWYNQSEGTFVTSADTVANVAGKFPGIFNANDGTANNRIIQYVNNAGSQIGLQTTISGAPTTTTTANTISSNISFKVASAYQSGPIAVVLNGGTAATATNGGIPVVNRISIGLVDEQINGHIRQIAYYNTRLPNSQLQTLTAPSLATTLSLSFTNQAYTVGV